MLMFRRIFLIIIIVVMLAGCTFNSDMISTSSETFVVSDDDIERVSKTIDELQESSSSPDANASPEPTIGVQELEELIEDRYVYIGDVPISTDCNTLHIDHWSLNGTMDPFLMNSTVYEKGIGIFVPTISIPLRRGFVSATWSLDKKYQKISFDMGCEETVSYGDEEKFGIYKIEIFADDLFIWDSGYHDYEYVLEDQQIVIGEDCEQLTIVLIQLKGNNNTLKVVLGNFKLYKNSDN